jgi:hypothetical protein
MPRQDFVSTSGKQNVVAFPELAKERRETLKELMLIKLLQVSLRDACSNGFDFPTCGESELYEAVV